MKMYLLIFQFFVKFMFELDVNFLNFNIIIQYINTFLYKI